MIHVRNALDVGVIRNVWRNWAGNSWEDDIPHLEPLFSHGVKHTPTLPASSFCL
jgi:hypothetical protein